MALTDKVLTRILRRNGLERAAVDELVTRLSSGGSLPAASVRLQQTSYRSLAGGASEYHDLTMYDAPVVVGTALTADGDWGIVSVREDGLMLAVANLKATPTTTGSSTLVLELGGTAAGGAEQIGCQPSCVVDGGAATKQPGAVATAIGRCVGDPAPLDGFGVRVTNTGADSMDYKVALYVHRLA